MPKEITPRRLSMTDIIDSDSSFKKYSRFHDSFLEQLTYEKQKSCSSDIWKLHYI